MPSKSSRTSRTWFRRATRSWRDILESEGIPWRDNIRRTSFFHEVGGSSKSWVHKGIQGSTKLLKRYLQKWVKLIGWYVFTTNFATWGLKPDPKKVVDYWVTSWYVTSFQIALQDTFREGPCRSRLKCHIDNHQNRRPKKAEQSSWSHDLSPNKQVYGMSGFPLRL